MSALIRSPFRSTGGSAADQAAEADDAKKKAKKKASEPTSHPLSCFVEQTFRDGHAKFLVTLQAPTLGKFWTVEYRFASFRDMHNAISSQCPDVDMDPFPVTLRRRSLGIQLTEGQMSERTMQLDRWVKSLLRQRARLSPQLQDIVGGFLNLEQLGDKLGMMVVSDSIPEGDEAAEETTGGGGGGGGRAAAANGVEAAAPVMVPPTPATAVATPAASPATSAIPVASAVSVTAMRAAAQSTSKSLTAKDATKKKNRQEAPHWKLLVKKLLLLGVPVVQHKYRRSKMGSLTTRPRLLRISPDMADLHLVAPIEGSDWIIAGQVTVRQVAGLTTGGEGSTTLAASFRKRGGEYASSADARAFTILASEVQWDLELSSVWEATAWEAITSDSAVVDEDMPSTLRDRLAAFLDDLIRDVQDAEHQRTEFQACPKFKGQQPGMVFKLGDQGLGYYRDRPPVPSPKR